MKTATDVRQAVEMATSIEEVTELWKEVVSNASCYTLPELSTILLKLTDRAGSVKGAERRIA